MKRLGQVIQNHFLTWVVYKFYLPTFNLVCDIEIYNVNVSGALGTRFSNIHLQLNTACIILLYNCIIVYNFDH